MNQSTINLFVNSFLVNNRITIEQMVTAIKSIQISAEERRIQSKTEDIIKEFEEASVINPILD